MNKVLLVGRLTADPELKLTGNNIAVVNFTVAVDRKYKDANGQKQADFINCVAWRQTADFIGKYFRKGQRIGLEGSIQTRTYDDNNGVRHYVTEVLVDNAEFVEPANQAGGQVQTQTQTQAPAPARAAAQQAQTAPAQTWQEQAAIPEDLPFEV